MYKVLIVDDEKSYVQSQIELAVHYSIQLEHIDNWEEAQNMMEENGDLFAAVIIDGKGKLSKGAKGEDVKQLTKALKWLGEQKGKGNHFHYVVNTGFSEDINAIIESEKVYKKLGDEKRMFEEILAAIKNSTPEKIKTKYADVFEIFSRGLLPSGHERTLISLIDKFNSSKIEKGDFNSVRDILEAVYKKLNQAKLLPDDFVINGKPNLEWSYRYLSGLPTDIKDRGDKVVKSFPKNDNPVFPPHISRTVDGIKQVTSILSHDYKMPFSKYSVMNVTFGLMEVLLWLKETVK